MAGRGVDERVFGCAGPVHHMSGQPGTEHPHPPARVLHLQDTRQVTWHRCQTLQPPGKGNRDNTRIKMHRGRKIVNRRK